MEAAICSDMYVIIYESTSQHVQQVWYLQILRHYVPQNVRNSVL